MGKREFECTPWGNPTYNVFGWQRPCYLLQDGYAATFRELMEETDWSRYGRKSGNPRCQDCMVHCGFEPSAVHQDRKSTRLNSSHRCISYAVFCLKKKKKQKNVVKLETY